MRQSFVAITFSVLLAGFAAELNAQTRPVRDFFRDYFVLTPRNYSPDDPWTMGQVLRKEVGHGGFFYNCDGEECKRNSEHINWNSQNKECKKRRPFITTVNQQWAELKQRVRWGGCLDCENGEGHCACQDCQSARRAKRHQDAMLAENERRNRNRVRHLPIARNQSVAQAVREANYARANGMSELAKNDSADALWASGAKERARSNALARSRSYQRSRVRAQPQTRVASRGKQVESGNSSRFAGGGSSIRNEAAHQMVNRLLTESRPEKRALPSQVAKANVQEAAVTSSLIKLVENNPERPMESSRKVQLQDSVTPVMEEPRVASSNEFTQSGASANVNIPLQSLPKAVEVDSYETGTKLVATRQATHVDASNPKQLIDRLLANANNEPNNNESSVTPERRENAKTSTSQQRTARSNKADGFLGRLLQSPQEREGASPNRPVRQAKTNSQTTNKR